VTFAAIKLLSSLSFIGHVMGYTRGGRLDEHWDPHCKEQVTARAMFLFIESNVR